MPESIQLLGKMLANQIKQLPATTPINETEFSVYSQFGEDGMLQFITHHLKDRIKNKVFVEIGVQNYTEANTRFLLENDAWQGVVIDSTMADIKQIRGSDFYWRNNLYAKQAFITRDNINPILSEFEFPKNIGLLSIDIDGNDYWVLKNIQVMNPDILIVEYNSFFGPEAAISVPYRENFVWRKFHPATYFGASLGAFCHLLEKEYDLIGSTLAGNNAIFVRKEVNQGVLPAKTCAEAYRKAIFNSIPCDNVDKFSDQLRCLRYHQVVNVKDNSFCRLTGEAVTKNSLSTLFNQWDDFLLYDDVEFIQYAYLYLLCRESDKDGLHSHLTELRNGVPKLEILRRISGSIEGATIGIQIKSPQKEPA